MTTYQVENAATIYKLHHIEENGADFFILHTSGWSNCGEWISLGTDSIAWSYLTEKMPGLATHPGDKAGWVLVFAKAGVEVFG